MSAAEETDIEQAGVQPFARFRGKATVSRQ
jgi:hypothetical protein